MTVVSTYVYSSSASQYGGVSLDLGTGPGREVLCFCTAATSNTGWGTNYYPKVAGDPMTVVADMGSWGSGWNQTEALLLKYDNPPEGTQTLGGWSVTYATPAMTHIFVVLKHLQPTNILGTAELGTGGYDPTRYAYCVDNRIGNLSIAVYTYAGSESHPFTDITGHGSGQELITSSNSSDSSHAWSAMDIKIATAVADGMSWSISNNRSLYTQIIPVYTAAYVPQVTVL